MDSSADNNDSGSVTVKAKDSWQMEHIDNLSRQIHRALGINYCFEIVRLMKLSNESDEEAFTVEDFVKAEKEVLTQWIYHPQELRTLYYRYRDMGNSPLISRMRSRKLSRLIPRSEAPKEETEHIDVLQHVRMRQLCYEAEEQWELRTAVVSPYYDDDGSSLTEGMDNNRIRQSLSELQRHLIELGAPMDIVIEAANRQRSVYGEIVPIPPPVPMQDSNPWWPTAQENPDDDDDEDPGDELYYTF